MRKTALFLALGLAYAYAVVALGRTSEVYYDSRQYFDYARNLLETGVYGLAPGIPDMHREPGYGFFLAGLFATVRFLGLSPDLASLLQASQIFWVKVLQAFVLFLAAGFCSFRAGLPARIRAPFFLVAVLSPTTIGAARELYSEALAIPLAILFLAFLTRSLGKTRYIDLAGVALAWAAVVLTKSYLYYASFLFLLAGVILAFRRRSLPAMLVTLAAAAGGLAAQGAWNYRGAVLLGENAAEPRLSIALAGKVARLDEVSWPGSVPVALAASLGTNFCDARFGEARCKQFDYRGCDEIGLALLADYTKRLPSPRLVDQAIKRDMVALYFHRPFTQLLGSGLELLRMAFFESVLDAGTLPWFAQGAARAWHVLGSLLLGALALVSVARLLRNWRPLARPDRGIVLVCGGILVYHAVTMSQITNVVRYVFPVLPFLYYFAADGAATLWEKRGFWKT